jgi:hypothetical protein
VSSIGAKEPVLIQHLVIDGSIDAWIAKTIVRSRRLPMLLWMIPSSCLRRKQGK